LRIVLAACAKVSVGYRRTRILVFDGSLTTGSSSL
jgi:hypothetical protein